MYVIKNLCLTIFAAGTMMFICSYNPSESKSNFSQTAELSGAQLLAESASTDKVTLCHKGTTIRVSVFSVSAHLGHGDSKGSCQ